MKWKKVRKKDLEVLDDIADDVKEPDFVPYSCLCDGRTVLSKNTELLQTIRITGRNHNFITEKVEKDLRDAIRSSVSGCIDSDVFSVWIHAIRKETQQVVNVPLKVEDVSDVAVRLANAWEDKNHFARQFANDIYVTIVREGQDIDKVVSKQFVRALFPHKEFSVRNKKLDAACAELTEVVDRVCASLHEFNACVMGVYEKEGVFYSEQIEFLSYLINFVDLNLPLADKDLSWYLTEAEVTFGFNAMEVRHADGRRRFASVLTLKEYKECSLVAIDGFLKNPIECIVTQNFDFVEPNVLLDRIEQQKFFVSVSGEPSLIDTFELSDVTKHQQSKITDYCQHQVFICIVADRMRQLESYVRHAMHYLGGIGLIVVREDMFLEACYWSQLPANFVFSPRLSVTYTRHVAAFANVQRYPVGLVEGNRWGSALTMFHTSSQTPYYFNFHDGASGHTFLASPVVRKSVDLVHFLLVMSKKYNPRIISIGASKHYLGMMLSLQAVLATPRGERVKEIKAGGINPFLLSPTEENYNFLYKWFLILAACLGTVPTDKLKDAVRSVLGDGSLRDVDHFLEKLVATSPASQYVFAKISPAQELHEVFAGDKSVLMQDVVHWNLMEIAQNSNIFSPYISLLLQLITDSLDGRPTILLFEEGLEFILHTHLAKSLGGWLDVLTQKNAMVLMLTAAGKHSGHAITTEFCDKTATNIFLSCKKPKINYPDSLGLTESEYELIGSMNVDENQFYIKRKQESVVAGIDLSNECSFLRDLRDDALEFYNKNK